MARFPRSLLPDGVYHVTTRGVARAAIFRDEDDRLSFLRLLSGVTERWEWLCYALCLMGNHYHLVLETTRARLSAGMHRLNGLYAEGFNEKYRRSGHLFGDRFTVRMIEDDEHLAAVCRYVVANPVRAGLCEIPADWRWSHSRFGLEL